MISTDTAVISYTNAINPSEFKIIGKHKPIAGLFQLHSEGVSLKNASFLFEKLCRPKERQKNESPMRKA